MDGSSRKSQRSKSAPPPRVRIETLQRERTKFYQEDKVHLEHDPVTRSEGENDEQLKRRPEIILDAFTTRENETSRRE